MLCVQRTGWGKSAVYFIATALLRERGAGPALIVSPLLALMRNQIAAAERLGIRAHTINSTNRDAWEEVQRLLAEDAVDLLLISPERLNNPQFRDTMLPLFVERVGLLVVDEAHCISDWGHDFRPDYRRLAEVLERLPAGVAVLCTTATANDRVVADVARAAAAWAMRASSRPTAGRSGGRACGWRSSTFPGGRIGSRGSRRGCRSSTGSGIVYTLTKRDAELVAEWLTAHGVAAEAYSGEVDSEHAGRGRGAAAAPTTSRPWWPRARWAWATTSPTSASSSTTRRPARSSPTTSRSGARGARWSTRTWCCCAARRTSASRTSSSSRPSRRARSSSGCSRRWTAEDGATLPAILAHVNLGRGRVEALLKVLDVEGAVERSGTTWRRRADSGWTYEAERYAEVTALRRSEQARDGGLRLRRALPHARAAGGARRPRPAGLRALRGVRGAAVRRAAGPGAGASGEPAPALEARAARGQEDGSGRGRARCASSPTTSAPRRVARSRAWATAAGTPPCRRAGARGRFDDELVDAAAELLRHWAEARGARWITAVPSDRSGPLVPDFAERLARARGVAVRGCRGAGGRTPAPARDGQLAAAGRQRARRVPGQRHRSPKAHACSSTTCASAAGRSRCSPASCAATASRRSTRSRSRPRSRVISPVAHRPRGVQVITTASHAAAERTVAVSSMRIERPIARSASRVEDHAAGCRPSRRRSSR